MTSHDSSFISQGTRCAGTLMLPETGTKPPVIVMAHGFGAIRAAGLMSFADRFVAAGYAVFTFDYRSFGDSAGEPRQWVSPRRHLQDWRAAVRHVRALPEVDVARLVLWGTSLSGGHVIQAAAGDAGIAAIIAQVPHVSAPASLRRVPLGNILRLGAAGLADLVGGWWGRPVYRPIVGRPGEVAAITTPEAWDGYLGLVPEGAPWENKTRARAFLAFPFYSPIRHAHRVFAPALVIAGRRDAVTPAGAARKAADRLPRGRFEALDCHHFAPYVGETFERNVRLQLDFLREVVPTTPGAERSGP
ncbi:alpha/beta hydrolase [Halomonas beimenensis]|uniref:Serine aminopeptidase S33 domain-containing protein n=1 Tax=Halomonas beimenensis TaxID=475662 RepID=A0A291P9S5_9GAMM|nr:alpha/beta fold hydrolase [Halomonas beimenensis]ATJ83663.1 hypothetical protein BEI_2676 [Halomonas beimenensis]